LNGTGSWINLSPFETDEFGVPRVCVFRGSVSKVFGTSVSEYFDNVSMVFVFSVSKFRQFPKYMLTLPKTLLTPAKS